MNRDLSETIRCRRRQLWFYVMLAAGAYAIVFFTSDFFLYQMSQVLATAIALIGLNLLLGINGQISFGHGAFWALGAYTLTLLKVNLDLPYWACGLAAGTLSFFVGFCVGLPAVRLAGYSLALATFALACSTPQIIQFFEKWTGGMRGLSLKTSPAIESLALSKDKQLYFVMITVLVLAFVVARNLIASRSGRALLAIRENAVAATSLGIPVSLYKSLAFAVSAGFAGLAGGLSAMLTGNVAPDSFSVALSISFVIGVGVGGVASLFGSLWGAVFIVLLPNYTEQISKSLTSAIFGVALLLVIYLIPGGMAGLLAEPVRVAKALRRRMGSPSKF